MDEYDNHGTNNDDSADNNVYYDYNINTGQPDYLDDSNYYDDDDTI